MDYRHVKVGRVSRPEITAVLVSRQGRGIHVFVRGVTGDREQRDGRFHAKITLWSPVISRSPSPQGDRRPNLMYTRAMLIGFDLVEVLDHSHTAFIERTGRDGLRLRLYPEGITINLAALVGPEVFPTIFTDPVADQETLVRQAEAWLGEHPALKARFTDGFKVWWYC